ncbi:MAG: carboxypeptidase-like regulatory domain-containing protein [Chitinophagales bacterium]|nr:carboxypeptidase-like regulatory domain-containing protein [Chitinophagales bacterium]
MKYLIVFILIAVPLLISAQTQLMGKVRLEDGTPLAGAKITLYQNRVQIIKTYTDKYGNYSFTTDPGTYDVELSSKRITCSYIHNVLAKAGRVTYLNLLCDYNYGNSCF